jgi:hypothetical protein
MLEIGEISRKRVVEDGLRFEKCDSTVGNDVRGGLGGIPREDKQPT